MNEVSHYFISTCLMKIDVLKESTHASLVSVKILGYIFYSG